ncbi:hypothetical protein FIBSPDRAFT_863314 [Athelia psychrophila]|uniref:Uncharacterized protein n=1 Tax=Athelia psychrophila TaxID=1759441 RepID=A0A166HKG0_9AGAM|nr:hypothetical protein FIBSPDRAFT_863314 [Fibularhizoctonia sp. CBS 109695]
MFRRYLPNKSDLDRRTAHGYTKVEPSRAAGSRRMAICQVYGITAPASYRHLYLHSNLR